MHTILNYLAWFIFYVIACFLLWFGMTYYVMNDDFVEKNNILLLYAEFLKTNILFLLAGTYLSGSWWDRKCKKTH